ncbi:conserved hypothetical protein [Talaromyces stipitatus ATCC 10500]|uniref:O-methyltransferase domain-containing protein n=1 Tax=Talaromyces stipitatus (strain ATCC 10500 / CBS 375.48 / QM 6759 / NRRL 1006) TaxID=441959 RepID=B8M531_TALSN|nr:uncharacterized protein TSTA_029150 [Talaromyces stipitatus ATCC 10500]EED19637.1 conserved hypothetical protein [Talaromyces stipitatus ATCC 10500]
MSESPSAYDCAMVRVCVPWCLKYPFEQRIPSIRSTATKIVIVDIGGNQGVNLDRLPSSFSHLDCDLVLQDLPKTLIEIRTHLDPRIRSMAYDFSQHSAYRRFKGDSIKHLLINKIILSDTNESLSRAEMDMLMLFLCDCMEHSKLQREESLAKVNSPLRIIDTWSVPGDQQSVIEACLAE